MAEFIIRISPQELEELSNEYSDNFDSFMKDYEKLVDAIICPEAAWYHKESMEFIGKLNPAYISMLWHISATRDMVTELIKACEIIPELSIKGPVDPLDTGTSPFA